MKIKQKMKKFTHHPSNLKDNEEDYFSGHSEAEESGNEGQNSDKEQNQENEDDDNKKKKVIKVRNVVRKPQPKLDAMRLCGDRGLKCLLEQFETFKPKGDGHEFRDLDVVCSKYEYWAHRLFPKMKFVDVMERLEKLGDKREVKHMLHRLRLGDTGEVEGENAQDPLLEDEARTAKIMNMMNNIRDSDGDDNDDNEPNDDEIESYYRELEKKASKKTINEDDQDNDDYFNDLVSDKTTKIAANPVISTSSKDEEDEDALFSQLLSANMI